MEARIPFAGFYDSFFSNEIDREEEMYVEHLCERHDIPAIDISEWIWRHVNYGGAYRHVAENYVSPFEAHINEGLGLSIKLGFNDMTSPREYNFETDKIFVEISYRDALILARRVGRNALRKAAKEMFTGCGGFISFYRNDPAEWGPLRGWDHNQLYCLFQAAIDVIGDDDYEIGIVEAMSGNGVFNDAFHSGIFIEEDLLVHIGKVLGKNEVEEEQAEDQDRLYPTAWKDTADYVRRYEALNKNIFNFNKL